MAATENFTIGADARCVDGACGQVTQVVIDPIGQVVTHLAVEPPHRIGLGRLVPLDLVEASTDVVSLTCTMAEFDRLEHAEETQFLDMGAGSPGGSTETLYWPYYVIAVGDTPEPVVTDKLPPGEMAIRRGEHVHATDGDIGRVQGVVVDVRDRHVTHVLLQEGHLWGRKEVAIPTSAIERDDGGVRLNITKAQVQDLPAVDAHHPVG